MGDTSVRVAVRIRPRISREIIDMCQVCTTVTPGEPQIWLAKDKAFTFDHVFDTDSTQQHIYNACVKNLVEGCFSGFNATVIAYGQTGSGKTYTMGTGFEPSSHLDNDLGIVPRAVRHIFEEIEKRRVQAINENRPTPEFQVNAQFLELYNEDIIDLLDNDGRNVNIKIIQENDNISIVGATSHSISSVGEAIECLKIGALSRTTASTKMNSLSSRSHAIFTLTIQQSCFTEFEEKSINPDLNCQDQQQDDPGPQQNGFDLNSHSVDRLFAKFHFVDLAGSERLKRTGATGERAREAIFINTGLLCLGNVISALGDRSKKSTHIPYRDSKLTRLLQDSLGGNSQTLMIACISPSDSDYCETLNTLGYANRAKNIKNKIVVNYDSSSNTIALLRKEIQALKTEIIDLKQGKTLIGADGKEYISDMYHENSMLMNENQILKNRIKALQETNERLVVRNAEIMAEKVCVNFSGGKDIVKKCVKEIEELELKMLEMEKSSTQQRKHTNKMSIQTDLTCDLDYSSQKVTSNEVHDMKRQKVALMAKMKEESTRHRALELQSNRKIAQLTKQERLKDFKIKNLESDNYKMKITLKRKEEEVRALRNKNKIAKLRQQPRLAKTLLLQKYIDLNRFPQYSHQLSS